jgi:hypothetical protein
MQRQDPRWLVTVIQDDAASYNRQTPVTGIMLSMNLEEQPRYQLYEYRSANFAVDPQNSQTHFREKLAKKGSGSIFESSMTKNWFSVPHDSDSYCSSPASSSPVSGRFDSMSTRGADPALFLAYQRSTSLIGKYQKALSKYIANLESGRIDALTLDSERAALLLLYRDAEVTVNAYQRMYNLDINPSTDTGREFESSTAVPKSENNSSNAFTPRARTRRVYHM